MKRRDFDNNRVANASESQKKSVVENYNRFYRVNKTDLTEEWSGEYMNSKNFK